MPAKDLERDDFIESLLRSPHGPAFMEIWRRWQEESLFEDVLRLTGSKQRTASLMGVSRHTVYRKTPTIVDKRP